MIINNFNIVMAHRFKSTRKCDKENNKHEQNSQKEDQLIL